ncbi:MAG: hypothetical protein FWH08_01025 [Oscillospiraceae bacterium]|nr:hypothetical protein [Oscillospiraceae bacterium]
MKKFVICLITVAAVFTLAISVSAAVVNNGAGTTVRGNGATGATGATDAVGGVVGAAENVVGGVVQGAENVVGGVVNGAENIVGGANHNIAPGNNNHGIAHGNNALTAAERDALERANRERNPATGVGLGLVEFAAIGTTMLGTAALAKKRR